MSCEQKQRFQRHRRQTCGAHSKGWDRLGPSPGYLGDCGSGRSLGVYETHGSRDGIAGRIGPERDGPRARTAHGPWQMQSPGSTSNLRAATNRLRSAVDGVSGAWRRAVPIALLGERGSSGGLHRKTRQEDLDQRADADGECSGADTDRAAERNADREHDQFDRGTGNAS